MRTFAKSDIGKAREMNQDCYYIPEEENLKIYILADGMGGYQGGEIASKLAVDSVRRYLTTNLVKTPYEKESIMKLVKDSIEYANMIVYEKSKTDKELESMGTTLDVCIIYNNKVFIGHVGDSRVYRIRNEYIRKLTTDHSYVETLLKDGTITKEEAMHHPKKNMLMKALGCMPYVEPDVLVKGFIKNDILIMTSDGLTNMITDEEIYKIAIEYRENNSNKENVAQKLVGLANDRGGYDNITTIVIYEN